MSIRQVRGLALSFVLVLAVSAVPVNAFAVEAVRAGDTPQAGERLRDSPAFQRAVKRLLKKLGVASLADTMSTPRP
jgi:hypothetical protein